MSGWLAIGAAGALGAWARYLVGLAMQRRSLDFPFGTLTVNVVGCLLLATAAGIAERSAAWAPAVHGPVSTGFIGAFTTFSTFTVEALALARAQPWRAATYVAGSLAAGLGAVALGGWLAARLPL